MANVDTFKDEVIDEDDHERSLQEEASSKKGHLILKGLESLEKIYDLQECFEGPKNNQAHNSIMILVLINLGTELDLKFVNIGMCCT